MYLLGLFSVVFLFIVKNVLVKNVEEQGMSNWDLNVSSRLLFSVRKFCKNQSGLVLQATKS